MNISENVMYITVRFGDSKEEIFNPNCRAVSLLRNIKDRCTISDEDFDMIGEIELSDENGNIKFLRDSPMRYANEILGNRESLVLLRVESRSDGSFVTYVPMLRDEEAITEEFLSRLSVREESESRPDSRRVKSNTRRSPADRGNNSRTGKDKSKNLKADMKPTGRSKSRQGIHELSVLNARFMFHYPKDIVTKFLALYDVTKTRRKLDFSALHEYLLKLI